MSKTIKIVQSHVAEDGAQLSVTRGDTVELVDGNCEDWWMVYCPMRFEVGYVPSKCCSFDTKSTCKNLIIDEESISTQLPTKIDTFEDKFIRSCVIDDPGTNRLVQKAPNPLENITLSKEKSSLGEAMITDDLRENMQYLRVYGGNFTSQQCTYRTIYSDETSLMNSILAEAIEKFNISGDGENYDIVLTHFVTDRIIYFDKRCTLEHVIEVAKVLTVLEAYVTKAPMCKASKKLWKRHGAELRSLIPVEKRDFASMASVLNARVERTEAVGFREFDTDFVTNYRFVLQKRIDRDPLNPVPRRIDFFIRISVNEKTRLLNVNSHMHIHDVVEECKQRFSLANNLYDLFLASPVDQRITRNNIYLPPEMSIDSVPLMLPEISNVTLELKRTPLS